MLGEKLDGVNLSASTAEKRHFKEILQFLLCGFASLAVIAAAGRPAKADDDPNSLKVHATAYLRIDLDKKLLYSSAGQAALGEFELYKNTQKQLFFTPTILRAALRQPGVVEISAIKDQKNPAEWLKHNLQVTFPGNAQIMQVSLSGASPKELALLVNAVVDAYMKEIVEADRTKLQERLIELKNIQIQKTQELKDSLNDLRRTGDYLSASDSENLSQQQKNWLDELAALRQEFLREKFESNRMQGELKAKQAEYDSLKNPPITDADIQGMLQSDPILRELGVQLSKLEGDESKKYKEIYEKYQNRIEELKKEFAQKRLIESGREIKKLEATIAVSQKQLDTTMEELRELRKKADSIGSPSTDMQTRRAMIPILQKSIDSITEQIESLKIESQTPPRVTVLDKAEVPE